MDAHAWMILTRSLGIAEYSDDFNREIIATARENGLTPWIARFRSAIKERFARDQKSYKMQTVPPSDNTCCHA